MVRISTKPALLQNCVQRQAVYKRGDRHHPEAVTPPRTLLSAEERARLFAPLADPAELVRYNMLDADDLALIRTKRRSISRLGFAVQLCLLRYPSFQAASLGTRFHPPGFEKD